MRSLRGVNVRDAVAPNFGSKRAFITLSDAEEAAMVFDICWTWYRPMSDGSKQWVAVDWADR